MAPVREHSRKPDEMYELIEATWPGPYVELFARYPRAGWHQWPEIRSPIQQQHATQQGKPMSLTDPAPNYGAYRVHPVADMFPLLDAQKFAELVASIRNNGLQEKITLLSDGITFADGRNRYLACVEAGVEPTFRILPADYIEEQIIDFIVAANLHRRQLTTGQLAAIAVEIKEALAKTIRPGRPNGAAETPQNSAELPHEREARSQAAKQVGVSHDSVQRAATVKEMSPTLFQALAAGAMTLNEVYRQAKAEEKARTQTQPTAEAAPAVVRATVTLRTHKGEPVEYPLPKSPPTFNPTNVHISWAAWSWNPVTGCLHGCRYCYAREIAEQKPSATYPVGFTPLFHHERLTAPRNTQVPKEAANHPRKGRVFVCSGRPLRPVGSRRLDWASPAAVDNLQWTYLC